MIVFWGVLVIGIICFGIWSCKKQQFKEEFKYVKSNKVWGRVDFTILESLLLKIPDEELRLFFLKKCEENGVAQDFSYLSHSFLPPNELVATMFESYAETAMIHFVHNDTKFLDEIKVTKMDIDYAFNIAKYLSNGNCNSCFSYACFLIFSGFHQKAKTVAKDGLDYINKVPQVKNPIVSALQQGLSMIYSGKVYTEEDVKAIWNEIHDLLPNTNNDDLYDLHW